MFGADSRIIQAPGEEVMLSRDCHILTQTYVKNNRTEWTEIKSMRAAGRKGTPDSPGVPFIIITVWRENASHVALFLR
jgi:hypothetical protein